jgi:hypothetical protein
MLDLRQGVQREFARAASIGLAAGQAVTSTSGGLLRYRKADGSLGGDPPGKERPRPLPEPSIEALKAARRRAQAVLSEMQGLERRIASAATRRNLRGQG